MEKSRFEDWAEGSAGTPEGDGDFESDGLPSTGETSAGGQLDVGEAARGRQATKRGVSPEGVETVRDDKPKA
jgi:hypothetical protein